jgi:hypothetical protein
MLAATFVLLLGAHAPALAQPPDFSGTWVFDASKSVGTPTLPAIGGSTGTGIQSGGGPGGGGRGGRGPLPAGTFDPATGRTSRGSLDFNRMTVKQTPTEVQVVWGGVELAYKLDGSRHNISAFNRPGFPQGQTAWEGKKLVVTYSTQVYAGKGEFLTLNGKEVWSLDGTVLTIEKTETTRQRTTENTKLVYSKAP